MWTRRAEMALCVLALACSAARADDTRRPPPEDPDPGFLEFLGSVDRLAEVNPEYLSQPDPPTATAPAAKPPAAKPLAAKPPVAPPPPPPPPNVAGAKNND